MKTYIYYAKNDPNQEAIGKFQSEGIYKATEHASELKNLPVAEFLSIFQVKEDEREIYQKPI
jgi:hypothetical protein